jgi:hypothetical protein
MPNRIVRVEVRTRSLDPAAAELWVAVDPEQVTPTTDVRGRWSGPRSAYASTVEVAYPLRPFRQQPEGLPGLPRRLVIPDPSFWEPESPFLYQGQVELWEQDQLADRRTLTRGLRTVSLGLQGMRVNGKPFSLRAVRSQLGEQEASTLRAAGINTVLVPVQGDTLHVWETADRLGFFVLGIIPTEDALALVSAVREQPSLLGCVVSENIWRDPARRSIVAAWLRDQPGVILGAQVREHDCDPDLEGLRFLMSDESPLDGVTNGPLPTLAWRDDVLEWMPA